MIYANFIFEGHNGNYHEDQDSEDQLVDIQWYCSESCYSASGHEDIGAYPCGSETTYCERCNHCDKLLWRGIACIEGTSDLCCKSEGA